MGWVRSAFALVVFVGGAWLSATAAVAAPQQLLNKTVTLTWASQSVVRDPDGKQRSSSQNTRYVIYVSTLGRLFEHSSRSTNGRTQGGDNGLNAATNGIGEARGLKFEGNSLVVNRGYGGAGGSGAMRAVATFDSSFASCTVAVTVGKPAGGVLKRKSIDGIVREILSVEIVSPGCSVRDGNGLAS